jgi:hypothetical protein
MMVIQIGHLRLSIILKNGLQCGTWRDQGKVLRKLTWILTDLLELLPDITTMSRGSLYLMSNNAGDIRHSHMLVNKYLSAMIQSHLSTTQHTLGSQGAKLLFWSR